MSFTEFALMMYPMWIMALITMIVVYFSKYRELLRIEKKPIFYFLRLLGILTLYRVGVFYFFRDHQYIQDMHTAASFIPWEITFTVFWEDAMHGLPLAIFALWLGKDKMWKKILNWIMIALVAISFGLGHTYQGMFAAFLLSFYVPFTVHKGPKIGFGTIMICHVIYDLATILTMKYMIG